MTERRLENLPLFEGLSSQEIAELRESGETLKLKKGEKVVQQGQPAAGAQNLYVLLKGHLRASLIFDPISKAAAPVARFGPGEHIGEVAFLDRQPRTVDVTADDDAVVFSLNFSAFQKFAEKHPRAAYLILLRIARSLAERLRHTLDRLAHTLKAGLDAD